MIGMTNRYDWPVLPMEPISLEAPFNSSEHLFQVKWDGVRCLVYSRNGIRLYNRHLNERTKQYPDLAEAFSCLPRETVLDGEIIVTDKEGKPSFPRVLQRDLVRQPSKAQPLMDALPAHYMAFDILWYKGRSLLDKPLTERIEILRDILEQTDFIHFVDSVDTDGMSLFYEVEADGLEGIVAKEKNSPYQTGEKNRLWQKIKCWRTIDTYIGGWLNDDNGKIRSLLVGIKEERGLVFLGAASGGIKRSQWPILQEFLETIMAPCPFINPPGDRLATFVEPKVGLKIRFLEYGSDGRLRAPAIVGFTGMEEENETSE